MKRKNNLFIKNVTYENIYKEYKNVKSSCRSQRKLFDFAKNLHINLLDIERKLIGDEYKFNKPFLFLIREPKYRIIMSESISDKIVNHFIANYLLLPVIDKSLIETNVATRKNRGASLGYNYLERYLSCLGINNKIYALKVDISKYFYNIDHNLLKEMIKRKIKDKRALKIINEVIDLTCRENINKEIENLIKNEKNRIKKLKINDVEKANRYKELNKLPNYKKGVGLGIGNVCSQIFAVLFLNDIDCYIKEHLKCKYYIRYMDDLVILDTDKEKLKKYFDLIANKINDYKLKVNPKSTIYLVNNSFTFLGFTYHIYDNKIIKRCRSTTYKKINKKLNYLKRNDYNKYFLSLVSYKGYLGKKIINYEDELEIIKYLYKDHIIIYDYMGKIKVYNDYQKIIKNKDLHNHRKRKILNMIKDKKYIYFKENRFYINSTCAIITL